MNEPRPAISVDTNVVSAIVRQNAYGLPYSELLREFEPALTYFVQGELTAADWNRQHLFRLESLLGRFTYQRPPGTEIFDAFAHMTRAAKSLGFGESIGTDLWILSQTDALGLPFVSHDAKAIRIAERSGVPYLTLNQRALELVEEDRASLA